MFRFNANLVTKYLVKDRLTEFLIMTEAAVGDVLASTEGDSAVFHFYFS